MHADCFLRSECSLLVRTGRAAIRCGGCQTLPAKATSSLALRRVQMLQLELQERKRLADAAAVEGALACKVKENKLYVIAMTVWATIRIMLLNRGVGALQGAHLDAYMQFYRSTASFPPQNASKLLLNVFIRARRFYNYFKRGKKLGEHSPMNGGQLLGVRLLQQDGHALSVLCSQAASFVYASDLMLRNDIRRLSEALIVLVEAVLIASSEQPGAGSASSVLTLAALNEAFDSITKLEFVQRPRKVEAGASSTGSRYKDVRLTERDFELFLSFASTFLAQTGGLQGANLSVAKEFIDKTYRASCRRVVESAAPLPGHPSSALASFVPAARVYYVVNTLLLQGLEVHHMSSVRTDCFVIDV